MHDAAFADAFRPPRFTVLLLDLMDFTIGHELVLWQRRNPLVVSSASEFDQQPWNFKIKALSQAVLVCCRRAPRLASFWGRRCANLGLDAEVQKFRDYRAAGSLDLPTAKMPRTQGHPYHYFGGPELARLINYVTRMHSVMVQTHFEGSPLNFPLGLARMLYLVDAECEGGIWIKNHLDMEADAQREAYEKSHPENTFAMGEDAVQASAKRWNAEHPDCPVPLVRDEKTELEGVK